MRIWSKEKNLIYQFLKTRICAFMTYGQFLPKSSSNLRFVVPDPRVRGHKIPVVKIQKKLKLFGSILFNCLIDSWVSWIEFDFYD